MERAVTSERGEAAQAMKAAETHAREAVAEERSRGQAGGDPPSGPQD